MEEKPYLKKKTFSCKETAITMDFFFKKLSDISPSQGYLKGRKVKQMFVFDSTTSQKTLYTINGENSYIKISLMFHNWWFPMSTLWSLCFLWGRLWVKNVSNEGLMMQKITAISCRFNVKVILTTHTNRGLISLYRFISMKILVVDK